MFTLFHNFHDICNKMYMNATFLRVYVKGKYANQMPIYDFPYDVNNNVCPSVTISDILEIEMVMILTLTLWIGQGQENMPIESPYLTYYLIAKEIFALSFTIFQIFAVKMYITLTLNFRMGQGQL